MILWLLAIGLLAAVALVGYYQGALRAGVSLVGLLLAALLCLPLGALVKPVLSLCGLKHPVVLAFAGPALAYLLILTAFKLGGRWLYKRADTHYKYHESDTKRLLWARLNQRVGICLGLANGTVYFFLICLVIFLVGYFTVQVAATDKESFGLRFMNFMAWQVQKTGMAKAVAPLLTVSDRYYDSADILGLVYQNPLLQKRLSGYPTLVTLAERSEFQQLANDGSFQEFWQRRPSLREFREHERVQPLLANRELYSEAARLLGEDVKDLRIYLETGKSPKYDEEKILGRWTFDGRASMALARKNKPNMGSAEIRYLRKKFTEMADATLIATIDNRAIVKLGATNAAPKQMQGTWKRALGTTYVLGFREAGQQLDLEATVEGNQLVFTMDNAVRVFEK